MFTFPISHSSVSGFGNALDTVISSVCCDLDATIPQSYPGTGQIWANLIAAPADSSAKTGYDHFLGATGSSDTDDPTFNGSAGDPAAYFSFDGGDTFKLKVIADALAMKDAHRTDVSGTWVALAYQAPSSANVELWGTSAGSGSGYRLLRLAGDDNIRFDQFDEGTGVNTGSITAVSNTTDTLIIVSWDGTSSSNNVRVWVNSTTKVVKSLTFGTNVITSTDAHYIGNFGGSLPATNGTRLYHFSFGNAFIDDDIAALIFTHLEARHNRDYTP